MKITFRKATSADINTISQIYDNIHTEEELKNTTTGWIRGVYPTKSTIEAALSRDDLFVEESNGEIVGTAILNQQQVDTYRLEKWQYEAPDNQIMVMHTLIIDPNKKGGGFGKAFAEFYEKYALENNCHYLRIDTNVKNINARNFYKKLGYQEIGILPCEFNGIKDVQLVLLEKKI